MNDIKKAIEDALNANTGLSETEYLAVAEEADKRTAVHGIAGGSPIDEAQRHARIQSNFYGTALNILMAMYSVLENICSAIAQGATKEDHHG